ncbi:MAG: DUF349 domain-containing protein [Flavobacteriaceae bacterium]
MENQLNDPTLEENNQEGAPEKQEETTSQKKNQEGQASAIDFDGIENASLEELVALFKNASQSDKWFEYRTELQKVMVQFELRYNAELQQKKETFLEEGGNSIDFYFRPPVKEQYDQLTRAYQQQKRKHYQEVEKNQKANQERKEQIIEEIKELIGKDDNLNTLYSTFKNLQDSWYKTGPAPRNSNNSLWQTYKHHVERFYDFVHLNRELRAKDYEHNYKAKVTIIEKAENLTTLPDVVRAGRDLDRLHRQWKEDLGPVAKEHREELWKRFQAATLEIHKKKQEYQKNFESIQKENLAAKEMLLKEMIALKDKDHPSHSQWQKAIQTLHELREKFKQVGPVPKQESKRTWATFRDISKEFNQRKNEYYRDLKSAQREHIQQAKGLLEEVRAILEADDWKTQSNRMKNIQKDWKNLGPIPRKLIVKLRKEFQDKCNLYFERLKSGYQKLSDAEVPIYDARQKFIKNFEQSETPEKSDTLLKTLEVAWEEWNSMGALNTQAFQALNASFQKSIDTKIRATKESIAAKEKLIFEFKRRCFSGDESNLHEELIRVKGIYETVLTEINQLENNLEFFSDSSDENPLVKEVKTKIDKLNKKAQTYQEQLTALRSEIRAIKKNQSDSSDSETTEDSD